MRSSLQKTKWILLCAFTATALSCIRGSRTGVSGSSANQGPVSLNNRKGDHGPGNPGPGPQGDGEPYDATGPLQLTANVPYYYIDPTLHCPGKPLFTPIAKLVFSIMNSTPVGTLTNLCNQNSMVLEMYHFRFSAFDHDSVVWNGLFDVPGVSQVTPIDQSGDPILFHHYKEIPDETAFPVLSSYARVLCKSDPMPRGGFDILIMQDISSGTLQTTLSTDVNINLSVNPAYLAATFNVASQPSPLSFPWTLSAPDFQLTVSSDSSIDSLNASVATTLGGQTFNNSLFCSINTPVQSTTWANSPLIAYDPTYAIPVGTFSGLRAHSYWGMITMATFRNGTLPPIGFDPGRCTDLSTHEIIPQTTVGVVPGQEGGPPCTDINVKVAVLDTGVDLHEDLNVVERLSFVDSGAVDDDNGHGTHVAGTIGAKCNGKGIRGIAPGARIVSMKILDQNGIGKESNVLKALAYLSTQTDIRAANLSFEMPRSSILNSAIQVLTSQGIMIIDAAGNDAIDASYVSPANEPTAFTIGAYFTDVTLGPQFAPFSNFGAPLFLLAPGVQILSTYPHNRYCYLDGTSMAASFVTGAVAYYLSQHPTASPAEVRAALLNASTAGIQRIDYTGITYKLLTVPYTSVAPLPSP